MKNLIKILVVLVLVISLVTLAQVPNKISYQGFLSTSSGIPAHNGNYDLRFNIYNLPSGGTLRHTETHNDVEVTRGSFLVILGPLPAIFSESLYVEVTALAGSPGISTDLTFSPRSELTSAPYAFHSWKADTATYAISAGGGGVNNWSINGNAGTTAGTNFVGTTDAQAFDIRTNNVLRTRITTKGQIETYNTGQSVFVGEEAGASDDLSANQNVFVGYRAGFTNTTGYNNTANGSGSLYFNTSGYNNTANGGSALYTNSTGFENSALGLQSLFSNTTGYRNTANGSFGLYSNTEGHSNTANGVNALFSNTIGDQNLASGLNALYSNTTGNNNTALGNEAGYTNSTGSGNVFLGHQAGYNETGSNKLYIANSSTNPPLIYGDFNAGRVGIGTRSPDAPLVISGDGTSWDKGFLFLKNDNNDAGIRLYDSVDSIRYHIFNNNAIGDKLRIAPEGSYGSGGITINQTGDVGIWTKTPLSKLHVQNVDLSLSNASLVNELITIEDSDAGLGLYSSDDGNYGSFFCLGEIVSGALSNKWSLYRTTSVANPANQFRFSFGNNPTYSLNPIVMALNENGNVGIGTTSPNHILDVQGVDPRIFVGTGGAAVGLALSHQGTAARRYDLLSTGGSDPIAAGRFTIRDITGGGLDRLVINSNGHVGIGTANPQGAFDVSSATGALIVPRMTTVQRDALTPINGMIIYNTTTNQFNFRENGAWVTK